MPLKISLFPFRFFNVLVPERQLFTISHKKIPNINMNARPLSIETYPYRNKKPVWNSKKPRWESSDQELATYIKKSQSKGPLRLLDLSGYHSAINIINVTLMDNSTYFAKALSKCPEVQTVNLSGQYDMGALEFACFRKFLPKLTTIVLKDIEPCDFRVRSDQFFECYAQNIVILADSNLMKDITQDAVQFLIANGQKEYALSVQSGITLDNLDPKPFQEALATSKLKTQEHETICSIV